MEGQVNIARPSVASLLVAPMFNDQQLSTATGFIVARDDQRWLITNWHVLAGRHPASGQPLAPTAAVPNKIAVLHNVAGQLGQWQPKVEELYDAEGDPLWLEHPTHGRNVDVVALHLTALHGVETYTHDPWSAEPDIAVGPASPLTVVGFPFGITAGAAFGVWVQGTVASEPEFDFGGFPCFLIDSRTRQGQSGSPVLFYATSGMVPMRGGGTTAFGGPVEKFLGVYSGRISDESDLGYVWKASALREILEAGHRGPLPLPG